MKSKRAICNASLAFLLLAASIAVSAQPLVAQDRLFVSRQGVHQGIAIGAPGQLWSAAAQSFGSRAIGDRSVSVMVELKLPERLTPEQIAWDDRSAAKQNEMVARAVQEFKTAMSDLVPEESIRTFGALPFVQIEVDERAVQRVFSLSMVESVGEEGRGTPFLNVTIPQVNSVDAYTAGATGSGQAVAVVDSGVDTANPFFTGKIAAQACFSTPDAGGQTLCANGVNGSTAPGAANNCTLPIATTDLCFHGTAMAGVAVGTSTAGVGPGGSTLRGVAASANLIPIMALSSSSSPTVCGTTGQTAPCYLFRESDVVSALNYVNSLRNTINIAAVNLSFGLSVRSADFATSPCDTTWPLSSAAVNQLVAGNIAVVAATGNLGQFSSSYYGKIAPPSCFQNATSVAAIKKPAQGGNFAPYSNVSAQVSLLAPGGYCTPAIYNTDPNCGVDSSMPSYLGQGNFDNKIVINGTPTGLTGTSHAAAHVSGAIAAYRTLYPFASPSAIVGEFQSTGTSVAVSQGTYSGTKKALLMANTSTHQIVTPTAPSSPQSVTSMSEHCLGYNTVSWSAPSSGTVTEYHLATSLSSSMSNPTLKYVGLTSPQSISVTTTSYVGVRACNLVSCSAWALANHQATVTVGCP